MALLALMPLAILLPTAVISSLSISPVSLSTTLGQVTGVRKQTAGNKMVDIFYSIPFAKPPVGQLRFRPPLPADPWAGVLDGTQKPKSCWQTIDRAFGDFPGAEMWNPNTPRSEDCMYLNIWRPSGTYSGGKPRSILVWIYGGGFYAGTSTLDIYDGSQLSVLNDIIVVSIAYRIGALGFLYLNDDDAPGNAGLLDQALALKWVKDNALNIGGSPESITIFGESAGAVSVGFHLLSPVSKDLFNYAILQSSSELATWGFHDPDLARDLSLKFASAVSCPANNMSASINCLRSIHPQILCDLQGTFEPSLPFPFTPVIDHYFIPDHPAKMIERGDLKNTSILLGVNKDEGIYFNIYDFKENFPLQGSGEITESQFDQMLPHYCYKDPLTCERIKEEYLKTSNMSYRDLLDDITGDIYFKCPVINFAKMFKEHSGPVYVYSFEHRVSTNPWPEWAGVLHGYEIELLFGLPLSPNSVYTEEEKHLSLQMMAMWTSFAKTGNPNYNSSIEWPEYTVEHKEYVVIDANGLKLDYGLRERECAIWAANNITRSTGLLADVSPVIDPGSVTVDHASLEGHLLAVFEV